MPREKTVSGPERRYVRYDESRWQILESKREIAGDLMGRIPEFGPLVHGSVARGDVHQGSDVDVVITHRVPSYAVEIRLSELGVLRREIVQATPWHLIKGHLYIEDDVSVVFPLVKPRPLEEQFYSFGGALELKSLERGERTPGVDKRLMLIEPREDGHLETSVAGREGEVAKVLGVDLAMVKERVDVLSRRDSIGRTGVYLKRTLSPDESYEGVLRRLADRDANLRRRVD